MMSMFPIDSKLAEFGFITFIVLFVWLIWIPVGAYVATQKRRSTVEGLLLGFLGPFGVIVEALLPTIDADKTQSL